MKLAIVGTGYVGLVTGTCLAETGNDVTCVDCDRKKIDVLNRGRRSDLRAGPGRTGRPQRRRPAGCTSPPTWPPAAEEAQLVFLAVGTPPADDGSVDLSALWAVVDDLAPHLPPDAIVVCKSTVPVGTNAAVAARLQRADRPRRRRGQQSRVPQGRGGDRRLHEARPRGHRRAASRRSATCWPTSTSRTCGPTSRSWSCRRRAPR